MSGVYSSRVGRVKASVAAATTVAERLRGQARLVRLAGQRSDLSVSTVEVLREGADRIEALEKGLKVLWFHARTSGGTAGRDDALCDACDAAERLLGNG